MLKGYVSVNPRWAGFKSDDYIMASQSAYAEDEAEETYAKSEDKVIEIEVEPGDFDLRGFEVARSELFNPLNRATVVLSDQKIKFNTTCVRKFGNKNRVEILINPLERKLAVRPTDKANRNSVIFSKKEDGTYLPREIPASAFIGTLFELFGWKLDCKYRIIGSLYETDTEMAYVFDACLLYTSDAADE